MGWKLLWPKEKEILPKVKYQAKSDIHDKNDDKYVDPHMFDGNRKIHASNHFISYK